MEKKISIQNIKMVIKYTRTYSREQAYAGAVSEADRVGLFSRPPWRTFPRTITDLHAYTPQICADKLRAKSLIQDEWQNE